MVKSSAYSPLDSLVDLACRDGVDIRPTLLRVITDLYVQKSTHTAEEEIQYVELALGLICAVDEATRAAVAARLSAYPNAPRAVLTRLAASSSGAPAAQPAKPAIARTQQPRAAPASESTSSHDLIELFFTANAEERRLILINLDVASEPTRQRPAPRADAVVRRLESSALQRNVVEFTRMLERGLGFGRELATRMVEDPSGEGIVIAAKSLGMEADVLQRILLFLNPVIGQSVERVFELSKLYDDITWSAADRMVAIWRDVGERARPPHAPVFWDNERANARARATPTRHRGLDTNDATHPLHRSANKPSR